MFVKDNSGASIREYFFNSLESTAEQQQVQLYFQWLMWAFHGFDRIDLNQFLNTHLTESELLKWRDAVKRIKNQEPIQYIAGKTEFYGLTVQVNPSVLIPRPETEELVDVIVKKYKQGQSVVGWDIGTGSGCIPLALVNQLPQLKMVATDISKQALEVAARNASINQLNRVQWIEHDILNDSCEKFSGFDFIVSNPPYVLLSEQAEMQRSVVDFEPNEALFVDDHDPLLFYKKIANVAFNALNKKGDLFFEVHESYAEETAAYLDELNFNKIEIKQDMQGKNRMVVGELSLS